MASHEIPVPNVHKVAEFMNAMPSAFVKNFVLRDVFREADIVQTDALVYSQLNLRLRSVAIVSFGDAEPMEERKLMETIRSAELPARFANLAGQDSQFYMARNVRLAALAGYPYAVLAVGHYQDTNEQVLTLFGVAGYTPQTLLADFHRSAETWFQSSQ